MKTFLATVFVTLLIATAVAFFLGWMAVTTERHDGKFVASLIVHTAAIGQARESAAEKAEELSDSLKTRVGDARTQTATGTVSALETAGEAFTLTAADGRTLTFATDASSRVTTARVRGLQLGDRVTVSYTETEEKLLARSIATE